MGRFSERGEGNRISTPAKAARLHCQICSGTATAEQHPAFVASLGECNTAEGGAPTSIPSSVIATGV